MTKQNLNPDPDPNPDFANDNGAAALPAVKARALASTALMALAQTFRTVDTTPVSGRPVQPLMQFRSREGGVWSFGQRQTIPEPNSLWAVNPASFMWGWICWGDGSKSPIGEKLVSIGQPLPDATELPDRGFPWQQVLAVSLKCISGADSGTEVMFKTNTVGGRDELVRLIEAVRDRIDGQRHEVSPIVRLENGSYPHSQYGKTLVPLMTIVDWMPIDGPAPAPVAPPPPSSPPPAEQPRRRRVG